MLKCSSDCQDFEFSSKRSQTVIIDSDDELDTKKKNGLQEHRMAAVENLFAILFSALHCISDRYCVEMGNDFKTR